MEHRTLPSRMDHNGWNVVPNIKGLPTSKSSDGANQASNRYAARTPFQALQEAFNESRSFVRERCLDGRDSAFKRNFQDGAGTPSATSIPLLGQSNASRTAALTRQTTCSLMEIMSLATGLR